MRLGIVLSWLPDLLERRGVWQRLRVFSTWLPLESLRAAAYR